jgi:uncharacterized protein
MAFVCLLEIHLHFPANGSLKGKRKELLSLKAQLQRRFGAAVAETDHHELWQHSTLSAALVGRDAHAVGEVADRLARWVDAQYPDGVRIDRALVSADEVLGG